MLGNMPHLVDYENIGAEERNKIAQAERGLLAGQAQARQDVLAQGRVARAQTQGRHFGSFQANQRNVASGTAQNLAKVTGAFAQKLAAGKVAAGQRLSALGQLNRTKDMAVDEINTKELDAVQTQNMNMQENLHQLAVEAQYAQNSYEKNRILRNLMNTKNFSFDQYDPDQMIKFVSELYKTTA